MWDRSSLLRMPPSEMFISVVSSCPLQFPYRTTEDGSGEVLDLVHDAGAVTLSVQSEGKETGGFYLFKTVQITIGGVCPADLSSDLRDVALTSETGRVRVSRW